MDFTCNYPVFSCATDYLVPTDSFAVGFFLFFLFLFFFMSFGAGLPVLLWTCSGLVDAHVTSNPVLRGFAVPMDVLYWLD